MQNSIYNMMQFWLRHNIVTSMYVEKNGGIKLLRVDSSASGGVGDGIMGELLIFCDALIKTPVIF